MSIDLPSGWNGRIVLGARERPVLHIATFPLPANDDDSGEIAKESLDGMYVNVRSLDRNGSGQELPVSFSADDFAEPDPPIGWRQAGRDVAVSDDLYRITAIAGDRDAPPSALVAQVNDALSTLTLGPYEPVVVPPLPEEALRIEGHGISMRLPAGWHGSISRGELRASSSETLGADDIRLQLLEDGTSSQGPGPPFITGVPPIQLSTAEFVLPTGDPDPHVRAITGRSFVDSGRSFVLWIDAGSSPPSTQTVEQANEALASLAVQPGDFYPGTVEPATFGSANGWQTGTNGTVDVQPDGQHTWTWAATVPYRDEPFQFPPSRTLEHLPPDGIVIDVQLDGPDPHVGEGGQVARLPFKVGDADPGSFEGMPPQFPLYSLGGRAPGQRYSVEVSVTFGRQHPTADQLAAADAELARLQLPDWTATD